MASYSDDPMAQVDGGDDFGGTRTSLGDFAQSNNRNGGGRRKYYIVAIVSLIVIVVVAAVVASSGSDSGSASSLESPTPQQSGVPTPSPSATFPDPTLAPVSEIGAIIRNFAFNGGFEFDDEDSYQSKALTWIEAAGVPVAGDNLVSPADRVVQRYALACIYYASNEERTPATDFAFGPDLDVLPWLNERGWLTFDDECDWFGIECNGDGYVEQIDLANNILTGFFSPETQLLAGSLKVLDIYSNYVFNVGDAGNAFLGELTNLEQLYYGTTSFQYDGIPTYIGKLTNLFEYDCSYTLYFGDLKPEIFTDLNKLEYLYIGGNSFNSSIPSEIGQLPNLLYFYAEFADIIGDLSFMKGMPNIYELWLDRNPLLTGPLYTEIGDLVTLESFSVTRCGLEGKIPSELGQLVGMQQMWLYDNQLTGAVPSELGRLTDMNRFEVEVNKLVGTMPTEVCTRVKPLGRLEVLEADCAVGAEEIACTCCTCCGENCATDQEQGNGGNSGSGGGARRRDRKARLL
jgi:hypothetical protein